MKLLIDCDVLLDVATRRTPHFAASRAVVDWCTGHPRDGFLASHTLSNFYYIFSRSHGEAAAREFIIDLLSFMEVAPVGTAQAKHAAALPMSDFEDAMQVAAAISAGVDYLVTRNIADYPVSPVSAILPAEILARLP
jgi:predicted nucleic acid-binding protein